MNQPKLGAHIVTPRLGYTHHGIYVGNGRVVHYSGLAKDLKPGAITEITLDAFTLGKKFIIKSHAQPFSTQQVVRRARSRIGENNYSVFANNCEHFCNWCIEGDHSSAQVDRGAAVAAPSLATTTAIVARLAVAASGSVTGLSGAGVMSSLSTLGAAVGGGAAAGIGVIGAAPGLGVALAMNNTVLADFDNLDRHERSSRSVGRKATFAGVGAGTAGSIAAVSVMGSTAGLSAAGISSGLAAVGGTVGGGMAAGAMITAAAPVAAAVAIGYTSYKIVRWFTK